MLPESLPAAAVMPPALLSLVAVIALVCSDYRDWRPGRYVFKPLAAIAFLWLALRLGATDSDYGSWLLAGLVFCLLGDLFLMPDDERSFLAGLGAFLVGHLLYAAAFLQLPPNVTGLVLSALPALLLAVFVLRWLLPQVGSDMKIPVAAYTVVITSMLLTAGLTAGHPAALLAIGGAWGFAASDIAVALRQFVTTSKLHPMWGTPLYFASQMLLAASVFYAAG